MNYPMPAHTSEVGELRQNLVDEERIAAAIVGVVAVARSNGQTLEDLIAEVLVDDALLDFQQRRRLSEIIVTAWKTLP